MNMLYVNPAYRSKYAQCIRLGGPMHHFPNHCHERTSGMSNSDSIEIWKSIPGYGGYYEASSFGRIRSIGRFVNGFSHRGNRAIKIKRKETVISQSWRGHSGRYAYVNLYFDGVEVKEQVHKLVLLAFVGPRPNGMHACHGLRGSKDNSVSNLRWDTPEENVKDVLRHGKRCVGVNVASSKLDATKVSDIRAGLVGLSRAMREFGIGKTQFYRVKRGESWANV